MPFIPIIIKFVLGHWQKVVVGVAGLWLLSSLYGVVINWVDAREDRQTLVCNEEQLQTQVDSLSEQLRIAREDADRNATALVLMREEAEGRVEYINRLEGVLNDNSLQDDKISARTREFWRQLNEQAKVIRNENTPDSS